jgi:hypothetical protein
MAADKLTGNMPTENMIGYFSGMNEIALDQQKLQHAMLLADELFGKYL